MKLTVKNFLKTQEQQGWYEGISTELEEQKSPEVDPHIYKKFVNGVGTTSQCERPLPGLLLWRP